MSVQTNAADFAVSDPTTLAPPAPIGLLAPASTPQAGAVGDDLESYRRIATGSKRKFEPDQ